MPTVEFPHLLTQALDCQTSSDFANRLTAAVFVLSKAGSLKTLQIA
jgi:hypothetical protein